MARQELEALWVRPGAGSTAVFVLVMASVAVLFVVGVGRAGAALGETAGARRRAVARAAVGVAVWAGLTAVVPLSGVLYADLPVPPPMAFFAVSNVVAVVLAFSPVGTRLVAGLPIIAFVAPQALRLPLELVLHHWYEAGSLPMQMTYEGWNFDIVTGFAALALGLAWLRGPVDRRLVLVFNVVGLALLLAVATIAVVSAPVPFRRFPDPPLLLPYHWPHAWIVPFGVSAALLGHLLTFRALARR
ncbi:MAG: hypothetical protein AAGI22_19445 [Planctomycetota bacterium]